MWPFKRKPKVEDRRFMNEDWKVGDIAECILDANIWPKTGAPHPQKGERLRVNKIIENIGCLGYLCYGLGFEGRSPPYTWECTAFRKLRLTIEPASDEFIAELRDKITRKEDA